MVKTTRALRCHDIAIRLLDDFEFAIAHDEQTLLDVAGIDRLIAALKNTRDFMDSLQVQQGAMINHLEDSEFQSCLHPKNWVVPKSEKRPKGTGNVVYFVHSPNLGMVKIGYTNNICRRTWGISRSSEDDRDNLRILALVKCRNPRQIEAYIHAKLDDYRIENEWFGVAAATNFISIHSGIKVEVCR